MNSVELNEVRSLKAAITESEKTLEMWRRTASLPPLRKMDCRK